MATRFRGGGLIAVEVPPLAIGVMWLAVILGITAGFVVLVRKLRERGGGGGEALSANQMLAGFRELHTSGELSEEEFGAIRSKLSPALRAEADSAHAGATTMVDAAASLRGAAELMAETWAARTDRDAQSDQRDPSDADGRDAQEGCDAAPPAGGDSTEDGR